MALFITSVREVMFSSALHNSCLFVTRMTLKLLDRFSQNSAEKSHIGRGRTHWILAVIPMHITFRLGVRGLVGHRRNPYLRITAVPPAA